MQQKAAKNKKYVQSYICSVSFPETIQGVLNMIEANKGKARWAMDIDGILNFEVGDSLFWTAPKWIAEDDIVFFYHTKRALQRAGRLLAEAKANYPRKRNLIKLLERACRIADFYSGKIFACASIAGATERFSGRNKHFISPNFAPLKSAFVFDVPLPQDDFVDFVKIGRSTVTALYRREFNGIKKLLAERNALPDFLIEAVSGGNTFLKVNAKNWASISCSPGVKFVHEAQLRAFLLDYFLNELKDRGTSILEECECFRGSKNTGRADYFVKVFGRWIPVEAKLNVADEKGVLSQVAKYTNIDSFVPKKGIRRNRTSKIEKTSICLLVDRRGIYFVSPKNEFLNCSLKNPVWKREDLPSIPTSEIRDAIKSCF